MKVNAGFELNEDQLRRIHDAVTGRIGVATRKHARQFIEGAVARALSELPPARRRAKLVTPSPELQKAYKTLGVGCTCTEDVLCGYCRSNRDRIRQRYQV